MQFRDMINNLLEMIYPQKCVLCNVVLVHGSERGICVVCDKAYEKLYGDICSICGKPLIDITNDRCHDCRKTEHSYICGRSMWVYEDEVQSSIQKFKYDEFKEMGLQFAKELSRYYNSINIGDIDMIVSVPLHEQRLKTRGYNQARVIAYHFSNLVGIELMDDDALIRVQNTEAQKQLNDKERVVNLEKAFLSNGDSVKGKKILLIDDIYTTGATINACAKALLYNGAKEIYYLALAIGRGL